MLDFDRFYDIFFIYHPDDLATVRRIAAQLRALGKACRFEEDDFNKSAVDVGLLKADVLRSHAVGVVLSPESAASQLCNELIQHAVTNSKRIVSLILDEDIEVEVHPAIADNPFVFFRKQDDLADRVEELRHYLAVDHETRLHTELLVAADHWQRRGRRPSQLLPAERVAEARQWLANGRLRTLKPSPLLVEYIHSSRRQRPTKGPSIPLARIGAAALAVIVLGLGFLLLRAALEANDAAQAAAAQKSTAQAQLALTSAAATAASDSAVGLVDELAATSAVIAKSVSQTAQARAILATQAANATNAAQAIATQLRATELNELALDADALRLVHAAEAALDTGDSELALALAWKAKDALDDPKPAYRILRRASAAGGSITLDDVLLLRFQPGGDRFAVVPRTLDKIQIYDSADWALQAELSDHEAPIALLAYSPHGEVLITASDDGEIVIRDGASGAAIHRLARHQGAVTAVAFNPSGDKLFSAGSEPLLVAWDIESGDELAVLAGDEGDSAAITDLLVTADGNRVIGWANEGAMTQWAADTLEPLEDGINGLVYRGYDERGGIGFSGGRSLPAYPGDPNTGALILWDLSTGEQIAQLDEGFNWSLLSGDLTAPTDELDFITFYDDLALLGIKSSDGSQRAVLVNATDGGIIRSFDNELAATLTSARFLDAETLLSATRDDRLILWSSVDGSIIRELASLPQGLVEIEFSEEGNTVVGLTTDGSASLWRLSDSASEPLETYPEALPGTGLSPSGHNLLWVEDSGVTLRAVDSGEILRDIEANQVSNAGAYFATFDGARVTVTDAESGEENRGWSVDWEDVQEMYLSWNGEGLLVVADDALWLMPGDSEEPQPLAAGSVGLPSQVAFATGGEFFVTIHAERALLWDATSGEALGAYPLGSAPDAAIDVAFGDSGETLYFFVWFDEGLAGLTAVALADNTVQRHTYVDVAYGELSPDGEHLVLALHDGSLQIIETATGEIVYSLPSAVEKAQDLRYVAEHGLLVTVARRELTVWDVTDGEIDQQFVQPLPITDFSLSEDAARILTRDALGVARLWQIESPAELLQRIAAEHPPRELTCTEREQHLVMPLCE